MNKQIFFGQYTRIASYFEGTELAAAGPAARPRARDAAKGARQGAARVFTTPYTNPVAGNPEAVPANLRAGGAVPEGGGLRGAQPTSWSRQDRRAVHHGISHRATEFRARFLFYKPSLDRLGIGVTVRTVDEAQYQNRLRQRDFDIITTWPSAVSRQRAAQLLGLAGCRSIRLGATSSASRIRPSTRMIDE